MNPSRSEVLTSPPSGSPRLKTTHGLASTIAALGLFIVAAAGGEPPRFIEVTAELKTDGLTTKADGTTKPYNYGTSLVRCVAGTNLWSIERKASLDWNAPGSSYPSGIVHLRESFWFTGTNLVTETVLQEVGEQHRMTNDVSAGQVPYLTSLANIGWLAFCSSAFLKTPGRHLPLPIESAYNPMPTFKENLFFSFVGERKGPVYDRTLVFKDAPGLPKTVDWYDPSLQLVSREWIVKTFIVGGDEPRPKLVETFITNSHITNSPPICHYEVLESTSFLGWHLPVHFRVLRLGGPTGDDIYRYKEFRIESVGRVKSIRAVDGPELPGSNPSEH